MSELVESLLAVAEMIEEPHAEPVVTADPDDDRVLGCALAGRARWIVSGDAHLLALRRHGRIPILTPTMAVRELRRVWRVRRQPRKR